MICESKKLLTFTYKVFTRNLKKRKEFEEICKRILYIAFQVLFLLGMLGLTAAITVVGREKDLTDLKNCTDNNMTNDAYKTKIHTLINVHTSIKCFAYLIGTLICAIAIFISLFFKAKLNTIEDFQNYENKHDDHHDIPSYVDKKRLHFFREYLRMGKEYQIIHSAFQNWFCIQYIVYLLSILTRVIHIIKYRNYSNYDLIYAVLVIGYDVLAFIIPFALGIQLNQFHQEYYEIIMNKFTSLIVVETTQERTQTKTNKKNPRY